MRLMRGGRVVIGCGVRRRHASIARRAAWFAVRCGKVPVHATNHCNDGLFFAAVDAHEVVGTVMAGYDGHRGWLYMVSVRPSHRKRGVGTLLVRHAERALAATGCLKINLQTIEGNAALIPFYEALGYRSEPRISMGRIFPENLPGP